MFNYDILLDCTVLYRVVSYCIIPYIVLYCIYFVALPGLAVVQEVVQRRQDLRVREGPLVIVTLHENHNNNNNNNNSNSNNNA